MDDTLKTLLTRRSTKAKDLSAPGPNAEQVHTILTAASRVPDHGRMVPFRFVVFEGEARKTFGRVIRNAFVTINPTAPQAVLEREASRLMHAPLVIAVIAVEKDGKHPKWEQNLTVGAVCQNMLLACEALGFGAQWLTQWFAYDDNVLTALGYAQHEHVAGFIHIGTKPDGEVEDRERPDLDAIMNYYE